MIGYQNVGTYPTPEDARAHFEEWIAFYQDCYHFPENLPVAFEYGFDSYKVTYCTDDAVLPGETRARTTTVTGMVSLPRKHGPLPTVAYVHGTSLSFYDAPSNPNTFGDLSPRGESVEGPPSTAVFAGNGFALQRELERLHLKVDATAVVGGVFDVERWFLGSLEKDDSMRRRCR